jgi:hypothetical protein
MGRVTDKELAQDGGVAGLEEPRPTTKLVRIFGVFPSCRSNQMPATSRWHATPMARRSISDCVARGGCGVIVRTVMEAPMYSNGCNCLSHCVIRHWVTTTSSSLARGQRREEFGARILRELGFTAPEGRLTAERQAMRDTESRSLVSWA